MIDLLLDTTSNDLLIDASGNCKIGNSDQQHQALLLLIDKGGLKENPDAGVGAFKYLESENTDAFLREVRIQYADDGMQIRKIAFENNKLSINAPYND
ncbi:oxidase [Niastella caeni]|uniref:Oxidase n=1 Tax=Niastella caeni TaxID=2569763 RepID=A0A4S8HNG5_9BACT|nr:oxidase [Niastella caeni]THU36918.1 oxidase [Niastella caeni]